MSTIGRVLGWVVLTPIVALVAGIGGCESRKAYYDWQVRKMCEKDGGVTITERGIVSHEVLASIPMTGGRLGVPMKEIARPTDPVYSISEVKYLRDSNPEIWRSESKFVRRADGKAVGSVVFYSRRGGDFPTFAHPSSFGCPGGDAVRAQIETIYSKEEIK